MTYHLKSHIRALDSRRDLALPGDYEETLLFCVEYLLQRAEECIKHKGLFTLALSGGSTPKAILKKLISPEYVSRIDWNRVLFFFVDERSVPPDHNESNYKMVMDTALIFMNIPQIHIFRMVAEFDGVQHAKDYEALIREKVPGSRFDLLTLGMGDDGHTASLFPHTKALHVEDHLVVMNEVPQQRTQRMTFTYPLINQAHHICFFVLGSSKQEILPKVLQGAYDCEVYPSQKIGTEKTKALWILDQAAATGLKL